MTHCFIDAQFPICQWRHVAWRCDQSLIIYYTGHWSASSNMAFSRSRPKPDHWHGIHPSQISSVAPFMSACEALVTPLLATGLLLIAIVGFVAFWAGIFKGRGQATQPRPTIAAPQEPQSSDAETTDGARMMPSDVWCTTSGSCYHCNRECSALANRGRLTKSWNGVCVAICCFAFGCVSWNAR
jgi:hypothetical protein